MIPQSCVLVHSHLKPEAQLIQLINRIQPEQPQLIICAHASLKSTNAFKSKYDILDDDVKIGTIFKRHWKNTFVIELPEETILLKSEKWYSSNRIVMVDDAEVARSTKKLFSFKPRILVHYKQRVFVLRPTNIMQTTFGLSLGEDGDYIGTFSRSGFFTNVYEADLPASIEKWFQCVLVSLIIEYKLTQAAAS